MDEQIPNRRRRASPARGALWLSVIVGALAAILAIVARWWRRRPVEKRPILPEVPPGLTEAEAVARWSEGQDNAVHLKPPRTRQQIWRENLYTIFNLNLVGLAFVQLLLARWLDALLSLGTILLNVGVNVVQEVLAMRRLAEFQQSASPKATVVREGKARSIDPNRVVAGDVLLVGPGDQFLVDGQVVGTGQMVVDASVVTGTRGWQTKHAGDPVYAGSFCISGRGGYVAQKVGDERLMVTHLAGGQAVAGELTPLERVVGRILRVLLVLVVVFAAFLVAAFFRLDLGLATSLFNDAASVVFNVAPSGLFLMIVVTYTTGTADLARLGALVRRARSVESLAEATVICFAEAGILTGTSMDLKSMQQPHSGDTEPLPESRLRQILGDYARSTSAPSAVMRLLANTFEGSRRVVREEAPFLAAYGWSAIAFDEPDLPGVYVLGEPQILESRGALSGAGRDAQRAAEEENDRPAMVERRLVAPLRRLLKRNRSQPPEGGLDAARHPGAEELPREPDRNGASRSRVDTSARQERAPAPTSDGLSGTDPDIPEGGEGRSLRRWAMRVGKRLRRPKPEPEQPKARQAAPVPETVLLFAYHPDAAPLYDAQGNVRLPASLIPLCELRYAQRLRPEAADIVSAFARNGVSIKVFAQDEPDQIVALFEEIGLGNTSEGQMPEVGTVSGQELARLPRAEWGRVAAANSILSHVAPDQAGDLVGALREQGRSVAVVGDGAADLPALQQANVAIARQAGTQAALGVADVVMMGNSPEALLKVLEKGQRIVHGLLDVLKLNLVQVFYLALLIVAIQVWSTGFPYASAQGGAVVVITIALPSIALTFWATTGSVSSAHYGRILARFVAPAAASMAAAAFVVYTSFLDRTGQIVYAQLALTYTLIYAGLLLAVSLKPPWHRRHTRDGRIQREWRMVGLALFLGVVAFFLPGVPAAQKYLKLDWLLQPADYGVVALVVVAWAIVLSVIWWLIPPVDERGVA